MKFKAKYEKFNLCFMTILMIFCFFTCLVWMFLKSYVYFSIYFIATLIVFHMYFFTSYDLTEDYLGINLGFLKLKFKYSKIMIINHDVNKIKISYGKITINLYPNDVNKFYAELNNKLKKRVKND